MAGREKIFWRGGYPFVEGVNAPQINGEQPTQALEVKPKPVTVTAPTTPQISHDLRAGHATTTVPRPSTG